MLAGEMTPDAGEIHVGSTVKLAHFKQTLPKMNENERMIEYIREASNDITDAEAYAIRQLKCLSVSYSHCMHTAHQSVSYPVGNVNVCIY